MTAFRAGLNSKRTVFVWFRRTARNFTCSGKVEKTIKKGASFTTGPLREFFEKEIYRMNKRERRSKPPWIPYSFQSSRWQ